MSKYGHRPHNWFEAIVNKLGGEEAARRYLRNELVLVEAGTVPQPPRTFGVWKTITLGLHKSPNAYKLALKKKKFPIGEREGQILQKITCSKTKTKIRLASATVGELGLTKGGDWTQIHEAIRACGGQFCPAEVGPALRLDYTDQPMNEWRLIAMESISDSDDDLNVFNVERHGDGLWLNGSSGHPDHRWGPDVRVVFVASAQVS